MGCLLLQSNEWKPTGATNITLAQDGPTTTKNFAAPNVNSVKIEKHWSSGI